MLFIIKVYSYTDSSMSDITDFIVAFIYFLVNYIYLFIYMQKNSSSRLVLLVLPEIDEIDDTSLEHVNG